MEEPKSLIVAGHAVNWTVFGMLSVLHIYLLTRTEIKIPKCFLRLLSRPSSRYRHCPRDFESITVTLRLGRGVTVIFRTTFSSGIPGSPIYRLFMTKREKYAIIKRRSKFMRRMR